MDNIDLKKLNRKQLLEVLLRQTERVEQLEATVKELEEKLHDRRVMETEAGSIAEASLRINGVFEAAQAAAEQYLENIRRVSESKEDFLNQQAEEKIAQTNRICEEKMIETDRMCEERIAQMNRICDEREAEAKKNLKEISAQIQQMYLQKRKLDNIFKECMVNENNE